MLKPLASTLNIAAIQSQNQSVHKTTRQVIEGFTQFIETYISSVIKADLPEEIINTLTLLSWYIHRCWKSLVCHIFPATKLIEKTYPQLLDKLPETLQFVYDSDWLPENFIVIKIVPSENIQKIKPGQK